MTRILVVDDDQNMVKFVQIELNRFGYEVVSAYSGNEALLLMRTQKVDLAVIDIMMPEINGFEVTKELKKIYEIPVILLTARHQIEDKEKGFKSGSDDYIVKPFEFKELLFRIQAILRRYDKHQDEIICIGSIKIDGRSYEVQTASETLMLPLKEFEVLRLLASRPKSVFTRDQIIESVWGINYAGDDQTVNVHIKRIRNRLSTWAPDLQITTVRGVGYKLEGVT
ncbi:response regulator transcription factor [Paenisporosarcina antarctica]|uniref:Heme response regulator HssR n=1 Tax=Paenisporosarcina antarctica TaxID=417367 RepID=A0A4P6ZV96_9BACL|nr:response regulator transcription factor [Paenisporosarcina antarctica]QBP40197.1 response regulator transcription factor [Paenisporosarcina antarctica]